MIPHKSAIRTLQSPISSPIGVFDSGVGGLTVLRALLEVLPNEDFIYVGDTARVPYGTKSKEAVNRFSSQIVEFLRAQGVKLLVVACNTVSAVALPAVKKCGVPVVDVIGPGAKAALAKYDRKAIGIIGTPATIKSRAYERAVNKLDGKIKVIARACPLFVPLVEEGWFEHPVTVNVAREYLRPLLAYGIKTVVLGCTHYPLLKTTLQKVVGRGVALIDSAQETAREVKGELLKKNLLRNAGRAGKTSFYSTDSPERFAEIGELFLGCKIGKVHRLRL